MDPKATAKSKRGHSLHGRRTHPTPSSVSAKKNASASAATGAQSKAAGGRRRPQLPSNWDRYGDGGYDYDAVGGEKGGASSAAPPQDSDIFAKSKGADYQYLIQQARSQSQPVASVLADEFAFDFLQGSCSMLSTRGDALLSLCEDDNFIVDDYGGSSNYEVPFLSMDLIELAGQLSKLKMSQRLFLEDDDLFGEEKMLISEPKENSQQPDRSAITDDSGNAETETVSSTHISVEKVQAMTSPSISPMDSELGKLIDSFKETNISMASENSTNASAAVSEKKVIPPLDDALDDLLAGGSLLVNNQTSNSVYKMDKMETRDNLIDELLEQAVIDVKNDKQVESAVDVLSSSVPAKQVDDFDSWFDSL